MNGTFVHLGENRRDAITTLQERLGPATPRPVAEQTYFALKNTGIIMEDGVGASSIQQSVDDHELRKTAKAEMERHASASVKHFVMRRHSRNRANFTKMHKTPKIAKLNYSSAPSAIADEMRMSAALKLTQQDATDNDDNQS